LTFAGPFATPESVLYDALRDRYLVSNINGNPTAADNNGYISVLSPNGMVIDARWIHGGKSGVALDAPKGLAISGDTLFVSDITKVRMFDISTGAPKGDITIAGSTFLNDVAADSAGRVFVTDSGLTADFKPSGSDAVWMIEQGKPKSIAKSPTLSGPNGIAVDGSSLIVATFRSHDIFRLTLDGQRTDTSAVPTGGLDGLIVANGHVYVSSWEGQAILKGTIGGTFTPVITRIEAPADIGFDSKRNRLLVPRFNANSIEIYHAM